MDLEKIGSRIKECRNNKKLTQEQFAEMIDVSPHYIYEIERGLKTMSLSTFINIISCLNVSADYILFGDTSVQKNKSSNILNPLYEELNHLSPQKHKNIMEILSFLIPYIK